MMAGTPPCSGGRRGVVKGRGASVRSRGCSTVASVPAYKGMQPQSIGSAKPSSQGTKAVKSDRVPSGPFQVLRLFHQC